jgi:biotin carboxyl carrier protein
MPALIVQGRKYRVGDLVGEDPFWTIRVDEKNLALEVVGQSPAEPTLYVRAGGRIFGVSVQRQDEQRVYLVEVNGKPVTVTFEEDASFAQTGESTTANGPALVNSPMAGKIVLVKTSVDSKVEEGQSLMVLEAMKMQNEIASPKTGILKEVYVRQGDLVKAGDKLCLVN